MQQKCLVDGCGEIIAYEKITKLEKPSIDYSFDVKVCLCSLHGSQLMHGIDEEETNITEKIKYVPLLA